MIVHRVRPFVVFLAAFLAIGSSLWLGDRLDQSASPIEPAYFLPIGLTFAIWGLIFLTGFLYACYQFLPSQQSRPIHAQIGWWMALTNGLTAGWNGTAGHAGTLGTPAFRAEYVVLTVFILAIMLGVLTYVLLLLRKHRSLLAAPDQWFIEFPVLLFFAWLNVAAIANMTAALMALGFTGAPYGAWWAVGMIGIATIVSLTMLHVMPTRFTLWVYAAVIGWGLIGIGINNLDRSLAVVAACSGAIMVVGIGSVLQRSRLHARTLHQGS